MEHFNSKYINYLQFNNYIDETDEDNDDDGSEFFVRTINNLIFLFSVEQSDNVYKCVIIYECESEYDEILCEDFHLNISIYNNL